MTTKTLQFTIDSINLSLNGLHSFNLPTNSRGEDDHYQLVFIMSNPRAGKANIATIKNLSLATINETFSSCSEKIIFKEKVEVKSCVEISIQLLLIDNKSKFESFLSDIFAIFLKPFFSSITSGISNVIVNKLVEQPLNNIIDELASTYKILEIANTTIDISEGVKDISLNPISIIDAMPETDLFEDGYLSEEGYLSEDWHDTDNLVFRDKNYNWNNETKTLDDNGKEIEKIKYLNSAALRCEIKYF